MREQLINRMIALYGLESPIVIQFCEMAERLPETEWNNTTLRMLVEAHEAEPQIWTED